VVEEGVVEIEYQADEARGFVAPER